MKSVIAIANQKGGVGKTTSAAALGVVLSREGIPVHLIDMDPQANLTTALGKHDDEGLLYEALKRGKPLPVVRLAEHLSLSPSSVDLARGEADFLSAPAQQFILQTSLEKTDLPDDALVILDCPPSLGVLSINCLAAADQLVIAVEAGEFAVQALVRLHETVNILRERINPRLKIAGAIMTNCDMREKITYVVRQELSRVYNLLGVVRGETALKYATGQGTILELERSYALEEYRAVAQKLKRAIWQKQTSKA